MSLEQRPRGEKLEMIDSNCTAYPQWEADQSNSDLTRRIARRGRIATSRPAMRRAGWRASAITRIPIS